MFVFVNFVFVDTLIFKLKAYGQAGTKHNQSVSGQKISPACENAQSFSPQFTCRTVPECYPFSITIIHAIQRCFQSFLVETLARVFVEKNKTSKTCEHLFRWLHLSTVRKG